MRLPISNDIVAKIVELYPNHTSKEIADKLKISRTSVNMHARRYNVQHSDKLLQVIKERQLNALNSENAKEKKRQTLKEIKRRLYIMERFRLINGEKQKTKVHISDFSIATRKVVSKYLNEYNYFQIDDEPRILYYDSETRRTKTEKFIADKYNLTFRQADG